MHREHVLFPLASWEQNGTMSGIFTVNTWNLLFGKSLLSDT